MNDPSTIYDFEGGLYPADIMDLVVLLNSDWSYVFNISICSKSPEDNTKPFNAYAVASFNPSAIPIKS